MIKLTYRGLKLPIRNIVVPQNPTSMADFIAKAKTAEMTINMGSENSDNLTLAMLKNAISSLEKTFNEKLNTHLQSISAISSNQTQQSVISQPLAHQQSQGFNNIPQFFQMPPYRQQVQQQQQYQRPQRQYDLNTRQNRGCKGCGKSCKSRSICPANNKICLYCTKPGHFISVCEKRIREMSHRSAQ